MVCGTSQSESRALQAFCNREQSGNVTMEQEKFIILNFSVIEFSKISPQGKKTSEACASLQLLSYSSDFTAASIAAKH